MEFFASVTMEDLKRTGRPTFNDCEHYLVVPHNNTMQTLVIELGNGKHMTVNINPKSDNVDVKLHGEHKHTYFSNGSATVTKDTEGTHGFYNMKGDYDKD